MAAPQIGINQRMFVTEIKTTSFRKARDDTALMVFINPKITWKSKDSYIMYE